MRRTTSILFMVLLLSSFAFVSSFPSAAAYTGSIIYNASSKVMTVIGVNPWTGANWTFWDCWNASYYNGWGVVNSYVSVAPSSWLDCPSFDIYCRFVIGDGSTLSYLVDTNKAVFLHNSVLTASGQVWFSVNHNGTLIFGSQVQSSRTGEFGCAFLSLEKTYYATILRPMFDASDCVIKCFGCSFQTEYGYPYSAEAFVQSLVFYSCKFSGLCYMLFSGYPTRVLDVNDIVLSNPSTGIRRPNNVSTVTNVVGSVQGRAVWFQNVGGYIKNFNIGNIFSVYGYTIRSEDVIGDSYIVDCNFPFWTFEWVGSNTGKVYRQYTFDLTVLNGEITDFVENANVTLTKNNVQIFSLLTNSSGQVPTQIVTYGYYDQSHGDSIQDGSYPFILTVTHPDWATYTSRFYVTEKTNLIISMQENDTISYLVVALILGAVVGGVVVALLSSKR